MDMPQRVNFPPGATVVLDIAGNCARVVSDKPGDAVRLNALGFVAENGQLVRSVQDQADRLRLITSLIDLGALFSSGRDWNPADVVGFFKDRGDLSSDYLIISWRGLGEYSISAG